MSKVARRHNAERRNARNGSSSTTNASFRDEDNLLCRARGLHNKLFPEKYDCIFDSILHVAEHRRVVNPISVKIIAATNDTRLEVRLKPFNVSPKEANRDTFAWLLEKLRASDEDNLRKITVNRDEEDTAAVAREAKCLALQTPEWQDQRIDQILASDVFLGCDDDQDAPNLVAFRVSGEPFKMNPGDSNEAPFRSQICRGLPGKTDAGYEKSIGIR